MALSGNKGEWSEIYALFKLLGDGKVHAGDADMNKLDLYYPILNVIREESKKREKTKKQNKESKKYEYKPDTEQNIVVIDEDGKEYARISMSKFLEESSKLLADIKNAKGAAFSIPSTESFMGDIGCSQLKASSQDKADIHIVIHDLRTNMTPLLGFSIKSQLGTPSTLLNAGNPTNITYSIEGGTLSDNDIERINSIPNHLPRMRAIQEKGCHLKYHDIEHSTFKNNLQFLDCCMPQFISECLAVGISNVKDAVEKVAEHNPLNFTGKNVLEFYAHKMKSVLLDAALGMTPANEWLGRYDANGGYLVVKRDGDIVCYHFYNRNDVEDYLYNNTRFERASRSRHDFGKLYKIGDKVFIKLNLQIRFRR